MHAQYEQSMTASSTLYIFIVIVQQSLAVRMHTHKLYRVPMLLSTYKLDRKVDISLGLPQYIVCRYVMT